MWTIKNNDAFLESGFLWGEVRDVTSAKVSTKRKYKIVVGIKIQPLYSNSQSLSIKGILYNAEIELNNLAEAMIYVYNLYQKLVPDLSEQFKKDLSSLGRETKKIGNPKEVKIKIKK
jgi:hypothetical protein